MDRMQQLAILRGQYPSTTSAAQTLFVVAGDLKDNNVVPAWTDADGVDLAPRFFEDCLDETIGWAVRESGETDPKRLLAFLERILAQYFDACPDAGISQGRVVNRLSERIDEGCVAFREAKKALDADARSAA
ncbi:hypothetical protein CLV78_10267 [Aliiruegeria haliotis]|uniref:Uncharacterized protein n=1 Tax=Aliiruegeria haliotis TaxID=1280846 RepID=A0A2T0RUM0_9RHOB|nr:hypothetical protein [Aliiruegeria haliotis]PRY24895.1 hypothetical protein CLV78_10267 [Aliiruegeria haliotis]